LDVISNNKFEWFVIMLVMQEQAACQNNFLNWIMLVEGAQRRSEINPILCRIMKAKGRRRGEKNLTNL